MKFLGIDTKIIGDDASIKHILETIVDIEKTIKIHINPQYLNKFLFVINIFGQNLYCDIVKNTDKNNDNSTELFVSVYNLNETQNFVHLLNQLKTSYTEHFKNANTVKECLNMINSISNDTRDDDISKFNTATFTFSSNNIYEDDYGDEDDDLDNDLDEYDDDEEQYEDEEDAEDQDEDEEDDEDEDDNEDEEDNDIVDDEEDDDTVNDEYDGFENEHESLTFEHNKSPNTAVLNLFDSANLKINISQQNNKNKWSTTTDTTKNNTSEIEDSKIEDSEIQNGIISKIINCSVKTKKYIKISLFKREAHYDNDTNTVIYDKESLIFINSFFISSREKITKKYNDIRNVYLGDLNNVVKNIPKIYKKSTRLFKDYIELNEIYLKKTQYTFDLICILLTNQSGIYLNPNDIHLSIFLNKDIGIHICNEDIIESFPYKYFNKVTYNKVYRHNYNKKSALDNIIAQCDTETERYIICDICEDEIYIKKRKFFYSNPDVGDICIKCYNQKVERFQNRIKYLKVLIIKIGKSSLFKKEKELIEKFLANKKRKIYKLKKNKSDEIKRTAFEIATKSYIPNVCKICFGELVFEELSNPHPEIEFEINKGNTNISMSCFCGHVFHAQCISYLVNGNECPYCRHETSFTRLFL